MRNESEVNALLLLYAVAAVLLLMLYSALCNTREREARKVLGKFASVVDVCFDRYFELMLSFSLYPCPRVEDKCQVYEPSIIVYIGKRASDFATQVWRVTIRFVLR